jgi:hypothetical protein
VKGRYSWPLRIRTGGVATGKSLRRTRASAATRTTLWPLHTNVRDNSLLVDMLSSAVFLPRVSGRAAKRALKRLRLLVAGRNWAALNSTGSQLIGVRYVQVGLEERENLTVTWNVSIAIRSLCVTLLAAILALVLVVTLAQDADAKHRKRRKKGVADFALVFHHCEPRFTPEDNVPDLAEGSTREQCKHNDKFLPPDRFSCRPGRPFRIPTRDYDWDPPNIQPPKRIDGYICRAEGSVAKGQASIFDLNDVLNRDAPGRAAEYTPPPGPLASPDLLKCHLVPNAQPAEQTAEEAAPPPAEEAAPPPDEEAAPPPDEEAAPPPDEESAPTRTTNDFSCEFAENQQTCVITMHELVPTNVDLVDDGETTHKDLDRWDVPPGDLPPKDEVDRFNDLYLPIACHPVPLAVPAGADAAGEGSAAWLFGLVLAAGGAMVGGVVIARRRFLQ